ncbi:MAG: CRISPR-associated helicase Cas3' [Anaerolineaceae bacterium]
MNTTQSFFAHSKTGNPEDWQKLIDHLTNTAQIANELGNDAGIAPYAALAALMHDIGKYSQAFQKRLRGNTKIVDHSSAGAQEITKLFSESNNKIIGTILAYCIAGHHSGLPDYGSKLDLETDSSLQGRLKKQLEDYHTYQAEVDATSYTLPPYLPVHLQTKLGGFSVSFLTRMIYSVLVDADFLETERFMNGGAKSRGSHEEIPVLCQRMNQSLEQFMHPTNLINQYRTDTLIACIEAASKSPGFFTLTVPTGGGKTNSSLAFALNHAVKHGLNRIIYVIPYTSIIEQNAAIFKDVLGHENVLEHHSNFDWETLKPTSDQLEADQLTLSAIEKLKLSSENWDIPVVVTTNVQFFESLFSNRSSACRKLHNLAKSVIIFDETQMLPRAYIKPCLMAANELVRNYGASIVFCSATQPIVQKFLPPGTILEEITPKPEALYEVYKRIEVHDLGKVKDAELIIRMQEYDQSLCIVNTRKHAKGLFDALSEDGKFHLSTLMYAAHRKRVIDNIRERLKNGQKCRVISTQIMEAGIDIDFPVGFRAIAGLDSIIQSGGRVNRENKQSSATLYVFEPDSEFVGRTPSYIAQAAEVTKNILRTYQGRDPVNLDAIKDYYTLLYDLQDTTAFDQKDILGCFEKSGVNDAVFDFKTAAQNFRLIEDNTVAVIIPVEEKAKTLLNELRFSDQPWKYSRPLQPFTVNIYMQEYQTLSSLGVIDVYQDSYSVLNCPEKYYNTATGLIIPPSKGGRALFFDG